VGKGSVITRCKYFSGIAANVLFGEMTPATANMISRKDINHPCVNENYEFMAYHGFTGGNGEQDL
jgi:hypothetical protein